METGISTSGKYDFVSRLTGWQLVKTQLHISARTVSGKNTWLIFERAGNHIWHYSFFPSNRTTDLLTTIVKKQNGNDLPIKLKEYPDKIVVAETLIKLELKKKPWVLRFLDRAGQEICGENPGDVDGLGNFFNLPLGFEMDRNNVKACVHSFHLHPDERLYGLGEKFTRLDKVGQKISSWNVDALGSTSERSHKNIPFLLSNRGYGIFVNTSARLQWELGTLSTQSFTFSVPLDHLDVYLIFGKTPADIIKKYSDLTGHAPVPPKWSFGLWLSSTGRYRDQPAMEKLVTGLEDHKIPADVIHLDTWWMRWRKYCDFQWDRQAFPEYQDFINNLHQQNLKLSLWMQPYISIESELFEAGKRLNYFARRPDGSVSGSSYINTDGIGGVLFEPKGPRLPVDS